MDLKSHIRAVKDFPKPGIMFRDITPLLASPPAFKESIRQLARAVKGLRRAESPIAAVNGKDPDPPEALRTLVSGGAALSPDIAWTLEALGWGRLVTPDRAADRRNGMAAVAADPSRHP